jgi:methylmalonyl-CoA/ethylmalonyl-CoA epimerase
MAEFPCLHHVNYLVRDLEHSVETLQAILRSEPIFESLPHKAALTARFRLGDTWLVIVQPVSRDSPLMPLLEERGEGLFLLSLGVASLDDTEARLADSGIEVIGDGPRKGLFDWTVRDIDAVSGLGPVLQIC